MNPSFDLELSVIETLRERGPLTASHLIDALECPRCGEAPSGLRDTVKDLTRRHVLMIDGALRFRLRDEKARA